MIIKYRKDRKLSEGTLKGNLTNLKKIKNVKRTVPYYDTRGLYNIGIEATNFLERTSQFFKYEIDL